jgi:hypothetical protein
MLNLLAYLINGVLGGFIYCIMPPMVTEAKAIFQRLAAGVIVGYLYFWALGDAPLEWQIVASIIGTAYWGIDFLKAFMDKLKPNSDSNGGVPI